MNELEQKIEFKHETKKAKTSKLLQLGEAFLKFFASNSELSIKKEQPVEDLKKIELYNEFNKKFDNYLENEMYLFCHQLIDNGYTPSPSQLKILDEKTEFKLKENINFLFELKEHITSIPDSLSILWILEHYHNIAHLPSDKANFIYEKLNNSDYVQKLNNGIIEFNPIRTSKFLDSLIIFEHIGALSDTDSRKVNNYHYVFNIQIGLLNRIKPYLNLEDTLKLRTSLITCKKLLENKIQKVHKSQLYTSENIEILKIKNFDILLTEIDKIIADDFKEHKEQIINQLKELNINKSFDNKIIQDVRKKTISVENELPKEAQTLLDSIHKKYKFIIENTNELENNYDLENLYSKNLPAIVTKYILIDEDYRKNFLHVSGKNAEQLMLESLNDILSAFDKKIKDIHINKISDLSVTQRHTKSIVKSIS